MNYLFFDIECADNIDRHGRIYSIGYVLCSERFHVIRQEDLLINPQSHWNEYVLRKILAYPQSIFDSKPDFGEMYPRLTELFSSAAYAIGFSIDNDLSFLLDECDRYELPPFSFAFADVQRFVRNIFGDESYIGLEKALDLLEIPKNQRMHRSEDDAFYTMRIAKALCARLNCNLDELLAMQSGSGERICPAVGETGDFLITWQGCEPKNHLQKYSDEGRYIPVTEENKNMILPHSKNLEAYSHFVKHVRATENESRRLKKQHILIDFTYERGHFSETLALIQRIRNNGGCYARKMDEVTLFLDYDSPRDDGSLRVTKRNAAITARIENGEQVRRMPLSAFLDEMGWDASLYL